MFEGMLANGFAPGGQLTSSLPLALPVLLTERNSHHRCRKLSRLPQRCQWQPNDVSACCVTSRSDPRFKGPVPGPVHPLRHHHPHRDHLQGRPLLPALQVLARGARAGRSGDDRLDHPCDRRLGPQAQPARRGDLLAVGHIGVCRMRWRRAHLPQEAACRHWRWRFGMRGSYLPHQGA
jgi:hypothetical protein